jgi:hypothetical protein
MKARKTAAQRTDSYHAVPKVKIRHVLYRPRFPSPRLKANGGPTAHLGVFIALRLGNNTLTITERITQRQG